jgi:hypothetical protein
VSGLDDLLASMREALNDPDPDAPLVRGADPNAPEGAERNHDE